MGSVHRKARHRKHLEPLEWPSTPEIDGFTWELGPEPEDAGPFEPPSEEDRRWAAEHLNEDECRFPEDEVVDQLAQEAEAQRRIERGYCG